MQVLPKAAGKDWTDAERDPPLAAEILLDPGTNTLVGAWYLEKLLKRYALADNPLPYALADYNAGRGNVLKWDHGPAATNCAAFIEQIGFPEHKKLRAIGDAAVRILPPHFSTQSRITQNF